MKDTTISDNCPIPVFLTKIISIFVSDKCKQVTLSSEKLKKKKTNIEMVKG